MNPDSEVIITSLEELDERHKKELDFHEGKILQNSFKIRLNEMVGLVKQIPGVITSQGNNVQIAIIPMWETSVQYFMSKSILLSCLCECFE